MGNFMNKQIIGVDISDYSIEAVALARLAGRMTVIGHQRLILASGTVEQGRVRDYPRLAGQVKRLLKDMSAKGDCGTRVVFGLPESQVYVQAVELTENDRLTDETVKTAAQTKFPLNAADMAVTSKRLSGPTATTLIMAAASRQVITEWEQFFHRLRLELVSIELEPIAIFRGLYDFLPAKPVCLVDLGSRTANISFFTGQGYVYAYSSFRAGDHWTRLLAEKLKIPLPEAEARKIKFGLTEGNGQVKNILSAGIDELENDIREGITYFEKKFHLRAAELVLTGGGAEMSGLVGYLQKGSLNIPVRLGRQKLLPGSDSLYIEALGLALCGLESKWKTGELSFTSEIYGRASGWNSFRIKLREGAAKLSDPKSYLPAAAIIGVLAVVYLGWAAITKKNFTKKDSGPYPYHFILPVEMAMNTAGDHGTGGYNSARLVSVEIKEPKPYEEARTAALKEARAQAGPLQSVWPEPISPAKSENSIFPVNFIWLAYDTGEAERSVNNRISETLGNSHYQVERSVPKSINQGVAGGSYTLSFDVAVKSTVPPPGKLTENEKPKTLEAVKFIKIKKLDQSLNIRSGPGLEFAVIAQALSEGLYELIAAKNEWSQINLADGQTGWVYAPLTEIYSAP